LVSYRRPAAEYPGRCGSLVGRLVSMGDSANVCLRTALVKIGYHLLRHGLTTTGVGQELPRDAQARSQLGTSRDERSWLAIISFVMY
jgi:hypothetical protein